MKTIIHLSVFIAFLLLISIGNSTYGQDFKARISEANSVDVIIKDFERFKGFGLPQWARFSNGGKEIFAIWNDPFSGRSATFIQAYYYNGKKWILFLDDVIENTSTLSVMILQHEKEMVFFSAGKQLVKKCSLSELKPLYQTNNK